MPQWDNKKFEAEATELATKFLGGKESLRDLNVKFAKANNLNEEQIRRLSRAVNIKTFEQKFASLKDKKDRVVDFEVLDPELVIEDLFKTSTLAEKKAEAAYPDLPNQLRSERGWTATKTASVDVEKEMANALPKDPPIESQLNHWQKVSEHLSVKVAAAELHWETAMGTLQQHSKRLYWNRDEFEKDAIALYGEDALFELNVLRNSAKLPALTVSNSDAQKLAEHLLGEETEDTKLLKTAFEARKSFLKTKQASNAAKTELANLRKKVLG